LGNQKDSVHKNYADILLNETKINIMNTISRIAINPLYNNYILYIFGHGAENLSTKMPQFSTVDKNIITISEITNFFKENKNLFILMDACRVPVGTPTLKEEYENLYNPEMTGLFALIQGTERATPAYYKKDKADPVLTAYYEAIKDDVPQSVKSHVLSIIDTILRHNSQFEDKTINIPKFYFNKKMRDTYPSLIDAIRKKITKQSSASVIATRVAKKSDTDQLIEYYEYKKGTMFTDDKVNLLNRIVKRADLSNKDKVKYDDELKECLKKQITSRTQINKYISELNPENGQSVCNIFNQILEPLKDVISKSNYITIQDLNIMFQAKCKIHGSNPSLLDDNGVVNYKQMLKYLDRLNKELRINNLEQLAKKIDIRIASMTNKLK
jgi:hypothetical protein